MPGDSFVHLHLHTEYSLLDGAIRMKELMKKTKKFGMFCFHTAEFRP